MNKVELSFRHRIAPRLAPFLLLSWHEDGAVYPGVPDASYVMRQPGYETGWLELKAVASRLTGTKSAAFKIEPSQHQWISQRHHLVPVHFLLEVEHHAYLVSGRHHERLDEKLDMMTLRGLSCADGPSLDAGSWLTTALKDNTRRT